MLTREEQDLILSKVDNLLRRQLTVRRHVARGEMAPKRAEQSMAEAKDAFRDLLKELG